MADLSFIPGLVGGGCTGDNSAYDYNNLKNRPVSNINGTGIVIYDLESGVYNIDGTWKLTDDDVERETLSDDLFYVLNNGNERKLTYVSAGHITKYIIPKDGMIINVKQEEMATVDDVIKNLIGHF